MQIAEGRRWKRGEEFGSLGFGREKNQANRGGGGGGGWKGGNGMKWREADGEERKSLKPQV